MLERFKEFAKNTKEPYKKIKQFLEQEKEAFYAKKRSEGEEDIKRRQAWVSYVGHNLEHIFQYLIEDFCRQKGYKITKDKLIKGKNIDSLELSEVKRKIAVSFGEYMLLPDADVIIYKTDPIEIKAIISIKNSFRERYTETPYWKLKLLLDPVTRHIKVYMVTPDKDDEISFTTSKQGPRKARIVMEYELDGIFLAKEDDEFESSDKVQSIAAIFDELERIL